MTERVSTMTEERAEEIYFTLLGQRDIPQCGISNVECEVALAMAIRQLLQKKADRS